MASAGVAASLVALIRCGDEAAMLVCLQALRNLTVQCSEAKCAILTAGGIEPLIALVRRSDDPTRDEAICLLANLANTKTGGTPELKRDIVSAGAVEPLMALAQVDSDSGELAERCLRILGVPLQSVPADSAPEAVRAYLRTHDLRGSMRQALVAAIEQRAPDPTAFLAAYFYRAPTATAATHDMDGTALHAYLSAHDLVTPLRDAFAAAIRARTDDPAAFLAAHFREAAAAAPAAAADAPASDVPALAKAPVSFELLGPGVELVDGGRGVQLATQNNAFALAAVLRSGTASATFKLVFKGKCVIVVGVFPADLELDSEVFSADGKRCALWVASYGGGGALVKCDGETSDAIRGIGWQPGDEIEVRVALEGTTTARVTFHSSRVDLTTLGRTLAGVPACGVCFGVGLCFKDTGVTTASQMRAAQAAALLPEYDVVAESRHEGNPPGMLAGYANYNLATMRGVNPMAPVYMARDGMLGAVMGAFRAGESYESVLCCLAANAGFACLAMLLEEPQLERTVATAGPHGAEFIFGDRLNWPLCESQSSVIRIVHSVVSGALKGGAAIDDRYDIGAVFARTAGAIGTADFGRLCLTSTEGERLCQPPHDTPLSYVKHFWPRLFHLHVRPMCSQSLEWPIVFLEAFTKVAAQLMDAEIISPLAVMAIAAESAIPCSKVPLEGWADDSVHVLTQSKPLYEGDTGATVEH